MVDWRGQPGRFLRLELRTPRSISYTCVTGPEDPANPSGPPLGAAIDASAPYGANAIQCYNATRDDGYYVYFSNDCFSILRAADPPARYVIEGLRCKGKVADRDGEKIRWLTANGTTRNYADPEALIFDVPIYIEAFITRYGY